MPDSPPDEIKTATPEAPVVETPKAEAPAASPPADGQDRKTPSTMLDAVMAAIKPEKGAGSSDAKNAGKDAAAGDAPTEPNGEDEAELSEDVTPDELSRYTSKTRKRIMQLREQRDGFRERAEAAEPKAQTLDQVNTYIASAGLSRDEVNTGFEIMRAMKQDPFEAIRLLSPYISKLQEVTGQVLPGDLQEQVRGGYISEAAARELAELRARNTLTQASMTRQSQASEASQRQAAAAAVQTELSSWETSKVATDPDYQAKKAPLVQRFLKAKWADGEVPKTAAEARKQADDVLKEVETHLRPAAPSRQEIRPLQGGTASSTARSAPSSTLEVVRRALGR